MPLLRDLPGLARLDDSIVAIAAALALLVIPAGGGEPGRLLDWDDTARAPWDVLWLFGGGLALADAITQSGLGAWLGTQLAVVDAWPLPLVMLAVTLLIVFVTEFASNVAAASSFVPVVAGVVGAMHVDALWLAMPAALAASWGFMMPAGTPPNAIAYATGLVDVPRMVRAGLWIDLLGLAAIPAAVFLGMTLIGAR
jgi:sodium-dependent dicarboxylate transporter 2/3/5